MAPVAALDATELVPAGTSRRPSPLALQRALRLVPQLGCLVVVGALGASSHPAPVTYLAAQAVVLLAMVALRGPADPAVVRRSRAGLRQGVVTSAVAVAALGALGVPVATVQLGVVCALAAWWGLGVARDSYVAAGAQLDAILATLPPPERAPLLPTDAGRG